MTGRLRTAVRGVLILGMAASVVANVLHAQPTLVARAIGAWSPLALLLTIELVARVPVVRPRLAWPRRAATTAIAGIAGWVSYWHTVAVCERFGESPASAHLIPFSVDGLIVVASVCLVEIGGRPAPVPGENEPVATPDTATAQTLVDHEVHTNAGHTVRTNTTDTPRGDRSSRPDLNKQADPNQSADRSEPAPEPPAGSAAHRPARSDTGSRVPRSARRTPPVPTDDALHDALDALGDDTIMAQSVRATATHLGIGLTRTRRLLTERADRGPRLTVVPPATTADPEILPVPSPRERETATAGSAR
ncbi:DUF2637 domain-containing protein [Frankia sp. CiP3]|uniref:DUF2637 domain-containing protein n=1 Tax=Frankia sp. CiP3 TaxID=2880971 RepID=UPI001EF6D990|nr:DUF2637 domain-containing protein [Frankia sp. CiP3]